MGRKESGVFADLSRRERQIMDVVYRLGEATASEVLNNIPDPPSINAVRRLIAILEEKGHLEHKWKGPRHVFYPTVPRKTAARQALDHLKETFFGGSTAQAMAALYDHSEDRLTEEDILMLTELIEKTGEEGR